MSFRDTAEYRLRLNEDPTGTINAYQRLDKSQDYIISAGREVYGIFNKLQNTIGYNNDNYYSIANTGIHSMQGNSLYTKMKDFNLNTDAYGFKWLGKSLNPELLGTKLIYMSDTMIGNLINISNNVQGLPSVSQTDINTVEVFTREPDKEHPAVDKLKKKYPVLNNLKWKSILPTSIRGDLTPPLSVPSPVAIA